PWLSGWTLPPAKSCARRSAPRSPAAVSKPTSPRPASHSSAGTPTTRSCSRFRWPPVGRVRPVRIDGSGALIAGGASGLGEATARRLHADGAHVVIADLNQDRGVELAAELGERAHFVRTDVTDSGSVAAAVAAADGIEGGL